MSEVARSSFIYLSFLSWSIAEFPAGLPVLNCMYLYSAADTAHSSLRPTCSSLWAYQLGMLANLSNFLHKIQVVVKCLCIMRSIHSISEQIDSFCSEKDGPLFATKQEDSL
jgi:hypothetical protein